MKNIEIYQPWGGLGDNLAHSIIPELCHQKGIKCFLSKYNATRNPEIHELVWGANPYLEKERGESQDVSWLDMCAKYEIPGQLNHIQVLQRVYGFDTNIEYPKIYYKPKYLNDLKNKTILDLSIHSIAGDYNPANIINILKTFDLDEDTLSITHSSVTYGTHFDTAGKFKKIDVNTLTGYSDILLSCKRFITLYSGPSNLASTIKHHNNTTTDIHVLMPKRYLPQNGCHYTYSNTNYIPL
jgi:hypothetical protein